MQTPLSVPKPSKRGPPRSLAVVSGTSACPHPPIDIRRNAGSIGGGFAQFDIWSDFVQGPPREIRNPPVPPVNRLRNRSFKRLPRDILGLFALSAEPPTTHHLEGSMTETITDRTVDISPTETAVTRWLADFERALNARNIDAAAALFVEDCYWRDLVAFTWNIITIEGPEGVRKMLAQRLHQVQPSRFSVAGG